jgi:hypothetical protein
VKEGWWLVADDGTVVEEAVEVTLLMRFLRQDGEHALLRAQWCCVARDARREWACDCMWCRPKVPATQKNKPENPLEGSTPWVTETISDFCNTVAPVADWHCLFLQPLGGGSSFEFGESMSGEEALALVKKYLKPCSTHCDF